MTDLVHNFGGDLSLSATGDLAVVAGSDAGQQRVLRRLLTNLGGYIWHLDYGAGLGNFVGQAAPAARISAVARRQMRLERGIARRPLPVTTVSSRTDGTTVLTIRYVDATTNANVTLSTPV